MNDIMTKATIINKELDLKGYRGKKVYHNSKLLLQMYSKVLWRIEHSLDEMEDECLETKSIHLLEAVENLMCMESEFDGLKLEERLYSLEESRKILELVNRALIMLKAYPENGEMYFDMLNKMYILNERYTEDRMLQYLDISRTTFYKEKKLAIHMLGVILWGFIIPELYLQCKPCELKAN